MTEHDWVSVGQYGSYASASIVSRRLSDESVPNRIWSPPRSLGEFYLWVPRESAEAAKRLLATPVVSEEELTALALKDPPPDDFDPSTADQEFASQTPANPPSEPPESGVAADPTILEDQVSYRNPLLFAHLVLIVLTALAYLIRAPIRNPVSAYFGLGLVMRALPAIFPYVLSALTCGGWVSKPRLQVAAFFVLLLGTGLAAVLLTADVGNFGLGRWGLVGVYVMQTYLYVFLGVILLRAPWSGP